MRGCACRWSASTWSRSRRASSSPPSIPTSNTPRPWVSRSRCRVRASWLRPTSSSASRWRTRSCGVVLTSSARDESTLTRQSERWSTEEVDALLTAVAGAPDFATAARFLVAQFASVVGAPRGFVLMLDPGLGELRPVATLGYDDHDAPTPHSLGDRGDPLVVAALAMLPVTCGKDGTHLPPSIVIPFAQSRAPDAPRFIDAAEAARRIHEE